MDLTFHPRFDCAICPTRCDGRSKSAYIFEEDVALSEAAEEWLAGHLADALAVDVYRALRAAKPLVALASSRQRLRASSGWPMCGSTRQRAR